MVEIKGEVRITLVDYHSLQNAHTNAEKQLRKMSRVSTALTILINDIIEDHNIQSILSTFNSRDNGVMIVPDPGGSNTFVIRVTGLDEEE